MYKPLFEKSPVGAFGVKNNVSYYSYDLGDYFELVIDENSNMELKLNGKPLIKGTLTGNKIKTVNLDSKVLNSFISKIDR